MAAELATEPATSATRLDDPAAFRVLYDATLPRIYGYFYHRCGGSRPMAEESTQETFVAAAASLRTAPPITAPLPRLFGIARHRLLDHYRRELRARGVVTVSWEEWRDTSGADLPSSDDAP